MKKHILLIASIIIIVLGTSLILIETEIHITLLGAIVMMVGILIFLGYLVSRGGLNKTV